MNVGGLFGFVLYFYCVGEGLPFGPMDYMGIVYVYCKVSCVRGCEHFSSGAWGPIALTVEAFENIGTVKAVDTFVFFQMARLKVLYELGP